MYIYLSEFMDYNAFEEKDLFWSKKGLEYGDWESGPNKDGTFIFEGSVQASEVSSLIEIILNSLSHVISLL